MLNIVMGTLYIAEATHLLVSFPAYTVASVKIGAQYSSIHSLRTRLMNYDAYQENSMNTYFINYLHSEVNY